MCAAITSGCEGEGNAGVGSRGVGSRGVGSRGVGSRGVVEVSAYMGGTYGSGVFSIACDMLEMSVARGVNGVCDMCMYLALGGRSCG